MTNLCALDGTTDEATSHMTKPLKRQVIGYSHLTNPAKNAGQVVGYSRALTFLLCALLWGGNAWAVPAATVTHMSGTLSAIKPDGSSRILSIQSKVESGDTVSTEKGTFARLEFTDGGEVVLRPNTIFKVNSYTYDQGKPKEDGFFASLLKGGARLVSGLVGKRGNSDAYALKTATATIGIRGTDYAVLSCQGDCVNLGDGTYTNTYDGTIFQSNEFGTLDCAMGQGCYSAPGVAPIILPEIPGGIDFTVPPMFLDKIGGDTVLDTAGHKECVIH